MILLLLSPQPLYAGETSAPLTPSITEAYHTDLTSGSAVASVQIIVPPGRAGIQPDISLTYSSSGANGICGVGWLMQMDSIQRSTKRGVPAYNSTDTFTANINGAGMELVHFAFDQYRAKQEGAFYRFAFDGTSWVVTDKSGTRYYFGTSANSRLEQGSKVFSWHLDKVMDIHGNNMTITYFHDSQIYPLEIIYTGKEGVEPGENRVLFMYDGRDDTVFDFSTNFQVKKGKRLLEIEAYANGQFVRKYVFTYTYSTESGRSMLTAVTQYGIDGVSPLPPVTFEYQGGSE
ncbi:MAG: SpvB/TcaC N-terminal domain-containing protein [Candidatus Omnitrophota bacterium]